MEDYPRWKYHATDPACIVKNAEEEKSLGEEWGNAPVEAVKKSTVKIDAETPKKRRRQPKVK